MEDIIKNNTGSKDELVAYLSAKAKKHKNYKHYTKLYKIETILNNNTIYLSNGNNWNDIIDKNNFNSDTNDVVNFGVCLSYSKSENIAMWMLYSGNDGYMIDYDSKTIKDILNTDTIEIGNFIDGVFVANKKFKSGLFDISIFDIVYYDSSNYHDGMTENVYVKRSNEINKEFPKEKLDNLTFQKKTLPWSYENECRIVVSIKKALLQNVIGDTVAIPFSNKHIDELKKRIYASPNSRENNYKESCLKNKINWDLCYGCKERNK